MHALSGKEAANTFEVKVGGQKHMPVQPASGKSLSNLAKLTILFLTSNFDLLYFCGSLTYKIVKYLI